MAELDDQINELMRSVQRPGRLEAVKGRKARPYPDSGRYYLVKQDLESTEDTYRKIAMRHGVSIKEVRHIAQEEGLEREEPQGPSTYNKEARIELLDAAFARLSDMLQVVDTPREMQQITSALSTLIDKRRLEDGEATERHEHGLTDEARATLATKLEGVAESRRDSLAIISRIEGAAASLAPAQTLPTIPPLPGDDDHAETIDGDFEAIA